jgi:hypothetical protein
MSISTACSTVWVWENAVVLLTCQLAQGSPATSWHPTRCARTLGICDDSSPMSISTACSTVWVWANAVVLLTCQLAQGSPATSWLPTRCAARLADLVGMQRRVGCVDGSSCVSAYPMLRSNKLPRYKVRHAWSDGLMGNMMMMTLGLMYVVCCTPNCCTPRWATPALLPLFPAPWRR